MRRSRRAIAASPESRPHVLAGVRIRQRHAPGPAPHEEVSAVCAFQPFPLEANGLRAAAAAHETDKSAIYGLRQLFAHLGGEVLFAFVDAFAYLEAAEALAGGFGVGEQLAHLYVRVLHERLFEQAGFG